VVVDVDEVLAMFMRGFERFLGGHGLEVRIDRYALFQNIYRPGETQHLDLAAGRKLFDRFFEADVEHIDPAPGAKEALEALAKRANIVVLTNAPGHSRVPRARWLLKHGFDYPFVVGSGPKGLPVAAIAAKTRGRAAFVDDLMQNLDSVAVEAPTVARFQMVADERLRPLAFAAPDRHARIDEWDELGKAIAAAIGG
jgi:phosphoglycolate phosphatase-like HAD superfamily hydrolase